MLAVARGHGRFWAQTRWPQDGDSPARTSSTHGCVTTSQTRLFRRYYVHVLFKNVQVATAVKRLRLGLPRVWKTCIRGKMRVVLHGQWAGAKKKPSY